MTSWRVLRLLAVILLIVCWFLVAWTSAVCQTADRKMALIDVGYTPEGLQFSTCLLDRWDYMMAVGEPPPLPVGNRITGRSDMFQVGRAPIRCEVVKRLMVNVGPKLHDESIHLLFVFSLHNTVVVL